MAMMKISALFPPWDGRPWRFCPQLRPSASVHIHIFRLGTQKVIELLLNTNKLFIY